MCSPVESSPHCSFWEVPTELSKTKQTILIAIATLMALGMVFTYSFGAPWITTVVFFALTLAPLFPLWRVFNPQSERIKE